MAQVVQSACPRCKQVLRIPVQWVEQPMRCKHCGLVFRARPRAAAAPPAPQPARPATPVAAPSASAPPAPPVATLVNADPFADLTAPPPPADPAADPFDFTQTVPTGRRRRRRSGGWWKGPVVALCTLAVAAGVAYVAWPYLSRLAHAVPEIADQIEKGERATTRGEPGVRTSGRGGPKKSPDTAADPDEGPAAGRESRQPAEGARPGPAASGPAGREGSGSASKFPRRALLISVNDYLYFNPVNYGTLTDGPHDVHSLVNQLSKGLEIPLGQIVELSDSTPDPAGKRGKAARAGAVAPVKSVIEKTVTEFLETSRAQDRLLLVFIGHAVELDKEVFLVPIEGERDSKESLIPLKWLYDRLAACKARQKVLVVDVCRFDPSRGFERPGSGAADSEPEGVMTDKIDEALKNPPAGVQVWSACVAGQHSLELENNGVFVDALWSVAAHGIDGVIQRPAEAIPVERLVEPVNRKMAAKLAAYGKKQTSRLAGKEPEEGAAYDPAEPPPPKVVPRPPVAAGDAYPVAALRKLLDEIDVPPIKILKEDRPLRAEALPPFMAQVMEAYNEPDGPDTELRKAVRAAVKALAATRNMDLRDQWPDPTDENRMKGEITNYQRKELAGIQRVLDEETLQELKKVGTPEARAKEPRRWQAHYDFVVARLEEEVAYLNEYQGLLGQLKTTLPPIDRKVQTGWRIASRPDLSDGTAKKLAADARKRLDRIVKDYPNTPWEVLARRDKLTALGMEWQAARLR